MFPFIIATIISLLAFAVLWWRVGDLFPIKIGKQQVYIKQATPGKKCLDMCKVLAGVTHEVKILTFDFPTSEYSKGELFREALEYWHKGGVTIKMIGGPNIEAEEDIRDLMKRGVLEAKKVANPPNEHILIIDNPRQLWIEKKHRGKIAKNIYYTNKPYQSVFEDSNSYFDSLWAKGNFY